MTASGHAALGLSCTSIRMPVQVTVFSAAKADPDKRHRAATANARYFTGKLLSARGTVGAPFCAALSRCPMKLHVASFSEGTRIFACKGVARLRYEKTSQLTLNQRVQGSSPCAPTNQTIEFHCEILAVRFFKRSRYREGFQRGSNDRARSLNACPTAARGDCPHWAIEIDQP
jgi:hypothetical protein